MRDIAREEGPVRSGREPQAEIILFLGAQTPGIILFESLLITATTAWLFHMLIWGHWLIALIAGIGTGILHARFCTHPALNFTIALCYGAIAVVIHMNWVNPGVEMGPERVATLIAVASLAAGIRHHLGRVHDLGRRLGLSSGSHWATRSVGVMGRGPGREGRP
ncbi:hypothetical protein ACEUZ9_002780 [Paracoccus litorisediminis]|uniref:hypothetical protein n=1 Tax=Paracoccus litorisediminis TaxID=2006130 RepID=UPI00372FB676